MAATHIVAWNLKTDIPEADIPAVKTGIKENLEALVGKVPGLLSARVIDKPASGSSRDLMLITTHESAEAIAVYAKDPVHNATADRFVRPYTCDRVSMNFED